MFYRECVSLATEYDVTLIAIGDKSETIKGVKVIGVSKPKSFIHRFLYTIFRVFYLAVKEDAHLYHIHDAEMVPFGIILSILGKPVIYDIHENTHDDILLKTWLPSWLKRSFATCYNLMLRVSANFMHFILVIADEKFVNRFFVSNQQSTIIQNFADLDQLKPYVNPNRESLSQHEIFYVGMIRDMYYNVDPLLEALYILKQQGINIRLHLIGYFGVKAEQSLQSLPFYKHIKEQIIFHGFLPMEQAYEISKQCKIGICLKDQPESMLLSHERKLFEYMATGLPSIFCDSEIYFGLNQKWDIGMPTDIQSSEKISESLKELLYTPGKIDSLSKNNLLAAQFNFNWKSQSEILLNLYHKLLLNTSI